MPRAIEHLDHRLGRVELSPATAVVAGSLGQWTLTYTVGSYGIDEGGTIKIARRFASDWGRPQFEDPKAVGYTTAATTGEAKLALRYDPKAHVRPWMKCLVIDVYDGCLAPGDVVTIVFGDRSHGSPGIQAQTFIESAHEMRVLVDPTNACLVRRLPSSPVVPIVSGPPVRVVAIVPTQVVVGQRVDVFVKGEDCWDNPTPAPAGVTLRWDGSEPGPTIDGSTLRFDAPTSGRVIVEWSDQRFVSNPISALAQTPPLQKYWAELHAQSDATVGTGTEREYFAFGRDHARVDIMSHQGNDFQVDEHAWQQLEHAVREFHEDGRFVVLPGFEWSANTAAGGDRNVIYRREGLPLMRSSHWQIDTPESEVSPAHPADDLFAKLRAHVDLRDVLLMAHCGGRYADIRRYFDEQLGPLVEVASCWGVFEWLLWDALDMNYRVGVVCNSDGHKGRPGAEGPGAGQFGIYGGLTCVLAESLTRDAVFEAMKARRCYGTTGPRIDLDVDIDGQPMGADIRAKTDHVHVHASVRGTAPIEALELYRGRACIHTVRPAAFDDLSPSRRVRLCWGGARMRGRGRRAVWDGHIELAGACIERAQTFAFDSPLDGIQRMNPQRIELRSRTTGDLDGVDLWLDQASRGRIVFRCELGELSVTLEELDIHRRVELGGLDLHAAITRYPETLHDTTLALAHDVTLEPGKTTPLFIKVIQTDGHLAWSSPVYVDAYLESQAM